METLEERILNLLKQLEEEKRLADKRAKQLYDLVGATDKISEGDSKVEVVDLGIGYIQTLADNQQVRKDQVLGNIQPLQPAFLAYPADHVFDVTGDGTIVNPLVCDAEIFDQGGDFAANVFTASVTGKHFFHVAILLNDVAANHTEAEIRFITSNRSYYDSWINAGAIRDGSDICTLQATCFADMDEGDTCQIYLRVKNGAKAIDILGGAAMYTRFEGALIC